MQEQSRAAAPSLGYAWFVVGILMLAYVFSFIDRQILALLVKPIRESMQINDTQMSLLMGFSFALFYTILGIPLGRVADTRSRRGLIAAGVVVWSAMTALCGAAKGYWQLFMFRIGVGVGEAALSPAAYSMIADYFPPEKRATAISVYAMGIYIGAGLAFLVGGLIVQFALGHGPLDLPIVGMTHPWQLVFFVLGGAGLVFAFAFFLVREPPRQQPTVAGGTPLRTVVAYLWANKRTVLCHNVGFALIALCSYGSSAWVPTFFVRTYGWSIGQVGLVYGILVMIFGAGGIYLGGRLTDRWLKQGHTDAALRVGLWAAGITLTLGGVYVFMPTGELAAVMIIPAIIGLGMPFGAAPAAIQEIMPCDMRGQASAVYLFVVNVIGLGIGPTAIALCTDYLFHDDKAVGWSILLIGSIANIGAIAFLAAGLRPYRETLARLESRGGLSVSRVARIAANGIELEYESFGDPAAPVILLIMGLGGQLILWPDEFCAALARGGFRVIRYDNRDVGLSTRMDSAGRPNLLRAALHALLGLPVRAPYKLDDMALDALGLLDALKIPAAHVVGVSMGGMIGQILAAQHPGRVRSLTVIMSTSGHRWLPGPSLKLRLRLVTRPKLADREAIIRYSMETWRLIGSPGYPPEEVSLRAKVERSYDRATYPVGLARQTLAIIASGSRTRLLPKIKAPVLVIHGAQDPLVPVASARDLARRIPHARLEIISGMGHDLPPALLPRLAQLILEHVQRRPARRRAAPARRKTARRQKR